MISDEAREGWKAAGMFAIAASICFAVYGMGGCDKKVDPPAPPEPPPPPITIESTLDNSSEAHMIAGPDGVYIAGWKAVYFMRNGEAIRVKEVKAFTKP